MMLFSASLVGSETSDFLSMASGVSSSDEGFDSSEENALESFASVDSSSRLKNGAV